MIRIQTNWPPSVNRYWRMARGRFYVAKAGKDYRQHVTEEVFALCLPGPMNGRLRLEIDLFPPDRRRRDIDNVGKAILDSLEDSGLFNNDEQVDCLVLRRREVCPPGRCEMLIAEIVQEE